jgi:CO/xanthine dehydrogenase FAD-binding subunit
MTASPGHPIGGGNAIHAMYLRPKSLDEALDALARLKPQLLAGGTDFYPALGEKQPLGPLLDITALQEIRGIHKERDSYRFGALTTWSEIVNAPLPRCFDALKSAGREIGGVQIQNRGTIAGNLCNASPAADGVPPLLALDAEVELLSRRGRRSVPLAEFIIGNRKTARSSDEIVTGVIVPRGLEAASSVFLKLGARRYLVISIVMVAAVIDISGDGKVQEARLAVGSCATRAQRLTALEATLVGKPMADGLGAVASPEHMAALSPIDDMRASAAYRNEAALTLVRRAINLCARNC